MFMYKCLIKTNIRIIRFYSNIQTVSNFIEGCTTNWYYEIKKTKKGGRKMFKKECTLCGGKLDGNNVCRECGLDNKKTDANYMVNRSSCDGKPLTHVHEEQKPLRRDRKKPVKEKRKKGKRAAKIAILFAIISVVAELVKACNMIVPDVFDNMGSLGLEEITQGLEEDQSDDSEYYDEDYDPYEYVTREIPSEGEEYSTVLEQGEYVVGIHIPEGIYMCTANGGYASFDVKDTENSIWLYEWVDEEQPEYIDLRLYEGAILEVMGDTPLELSTTNSQGGIRYNSNPLGDRTAYIVSGAIAGEAFEPGVYNMRAEEGCGQVIVEIIDEGGAVVEWKYLWMDADDDMESSYANLVLPEGATISWDDYDELKVSLVSSEPIATDDYLGYYGY